MSDLEHAPVEHLPYYGELKTCLPRTESELRVKIAESVGAASSCWENLSGAGVFESERAKKIAEDLTDDVLRLTRLGEPSLGCATTAQLLEELSSRIQVHSDLMNYRTVDDNG